MGILANLAHHVDVGGIAPGGMPTISTEIFQEGIRIPPIRIMKEGRVDQELMALIVTNVRTSREARGDFQAQLAANSVGQNRLAEIIRKYGPEKTVFYMDRLIDYSGEADAGPDRGAAQGWVTSSRTTWRATGSPRTS